MSHHRSFIVEYDKKKESEYENVWEKHNWEDFIFFLESISDYEYVDANENKKDAAKIKEDVYKKYIDETDFNSYSNQSVFKDSSRNSPNISLKDEGVKEKKNFFQSIYSRRTTRNFNYNKISAGELSWILRNSFYEIRNRKIKATNDLSQSLSNYTNSHSLWLGAIISINRVEGLESGFYFYDYINHSLRLIKKGSSYEELQKVVIGQRFLYGSAFSVFITVDFHNIFWRYRYSGAYKVILTSTAELAQKIITCAFALDLGAFETPAIRDVQAENILHTKVFHEEIMYYVAIGNYDRKSNYNFFAKFYDHMMGDREETAKKLVALINKHNKKAKTILDLACGTGEILRFFKERYMVEGIDNSKEMIDIARYKFPELVFYQGSMTKFYTGKKYDVIMSNFDSVNHLLELDKWIDFFTVCKQSLTKGGILIFDINTLEKLDAMCTGKKFKQDFRGIYTQVEVEKVANQKYNWQLEFFDSDTKEKISEENILETSFDKKVILKILKTLFKKVEVIDFDKNVKGGQNRRLYFVCKS